MHAYSRWDRPYRLKGLTSHERVDIPGHPAPVVVDGTDVVDTLKRRPPRHPTRPRHRHQHRAVTPPSNYAEMPRPTAKLTAEDMAPVNDPHGPKNKIGPTGRPLPDLPEVKPPTRRGPGAGDRDVQPEGRRRQDHDDHQPGRRDRRDRAQGAADRLRPAGLGLDRAGRAAARPRDVGLQPADAARHHARTR